MTVSLSVGGRDVRVANLEKVMYPRTGFTKGELIDYYRAVARWLLPHIAGRPLTLGRFPDGVDGPGWYQVRCPSRPPWMETIAVPARGGGAIDYCVVRDEAGLIWAANTGAIELHPFLWRSPDEPDVVVFDLDPSREAGLRSCARLACELRAMIPSDALVKMSGLKGLHVYVPVRDTTWAEARSFSRHVAERATAELPSLATTSPRLSERRGRVLVDWRQNDPRRSLIAPYSLRGTPEPAVSAPVSWDEVERIADTGVAPRFGPRDVLKRVESMGDLFEPVGP
jgi:bifunctional non-homologous end joining protein LigD